MSGEMDQQHAEKVGVGFRRASPSTLRAYPSEARHCGRRVPALKARGSRAEGGRGGDTEDAHMGGK